MVELVHELDDVPAALEELITALDDGLAELDKMLEVVAT